MSQNTGIPAVPQELKAAQAQASGAFPQLIGLGCPIDEIAALELELAQYLPYAHARIAQSLALVTWYAQKIIELTGSSENIKEWVIKNCCKAENDSDANGDSLQDFIEKIQALESESQVGDWNLKREQERDGQKFYAIYAHDVWKLVDHRFKPPTYNEKSLKALILKAGGVTNQSVRFSIDRDQVLAYNRLLLSPRTDAEGFPIIPNPPQTIPRKAWLIPASLFGETEKYNSPVTDVTDCNQNPVTPSNPDGSNTFDLSKTPCNRVTGKNELKEKKEEEKNCENKITAPGIVSSSNQNPGYSGYRPLGNEKTEENQALQPVTEVQQIPVPPVMPVTRVDAPAEPVTKVESKPVTPVTRVDAAPAPVTEVQQIPVTTVTRVDAVPESVTQVESQPVTPPSLLERINEVWNDASKIAELIVEASPEEVESALDGCPQEQIKDVNNIAIWLDEQNEESLYPPGIFFDLEQIDQNVELFKEAIAKASWDMITELASNWKLTFKKAVWAKLSESERKSAKELAPKPKHQDDNSDNKAPESVNLHPVVGEKDEPTSLLQIERDGEDVAGFIGYQVEVRFSNGDVRYSGQIADWDDRNGIITVSTEQGDEMAYPREVFLISSVEPT